MKKYKEQVMHAVFFIAACASVLAVALICLFLFVNGIPAMREIGIFKFLLGTMWKPGNNIYGILPMMAGVAELAGRGIVAVIAAGQRSYFGVCLASPAAWVLAAALLMGMYYYIDKNDLKKIFRSRSPETEK